MEFILSQCKRKEPGNYFINGNRLVTTSNIRIHPEFKMTGIGRNPDAESIDDAGNRFFPDHQQVAFALPGDKMRRHLVTEYCVNLSIQECLAELAAVCKSFCLNMRESPIL